MSGATVKVNPQVLRSTETSFDEVVDALGRIQADMPLGDAAAAAAQLLTAASCRKAQEGVTAAATAAIESVRKFSGNLNAAATSYVGEDESAADAIGGVDRARYPVLEGMCCC